MREWKVISKEDALKEIEERENSEEYHTRIVFIETIWKGSFSIPRDFKYQDFNPRLFEGTRKEYAKITWHLFERYGDTYGKIIGSNVFNTHDEYLGINRK